MSKVNPEELKAPPGPPLPYKPLGGPGPSNGYFECCGAVPEPINTQNILDDGGKFVTLPDGRILEYFVYGSDQKDARVIIEFEGTGGTGKIFTQGNIPAKCKELNVKGIGITLPGHAYSTVNVGRRVIDIIADVDEVLKVEEVDKFMVEGSSYGVPHALAVAWHYGKLDRVLAMHLHVPYLDNELAREVTPDSLVQSNPSVGTTATLQTSCSPFCMTKCICCFCLPVCGPCMMPKDIGGYPGAGTVALQDTRRSAVHSIYGIAFNNVDDHCSNNWGFDTREIKLSGPNQVLVSYDEGDVDVPTAHAVWLGEYFKATVNKNNTKEGHMSFTGVLLRGEFIEQLVNMVDGKASPLSSDEPASTEAPTSS